MVISWLQGRSEITAFLLEKGADPLVADHPYQRTPLHYAAYNGHTKTVVVLLEQSGMSCSNTSESRWTIGNRIAHADGIAILSLVLTGTKKQLLVDAMNKSGSTPLHQACHMGHPETVGLLPHLNLT